MLLPGLVAPTLDAFTVIVTDVPAWQASSYEVQTPASALMAQSAAQMATAVCGVYLGDVFDFCFDYPGSCINTSQQPYYVGDCNRRQRLLRTLRILCS
jgi:hypothetical protein